MDQMGQLTPNLDYNQRVRHYRKIQSLSDVNGHIQIGSTNPNGLVQDCARLMHFPLPLCMISFATLGAVLAR